ncbi:uncharacterized protein VP01_45g7 [Puccinia sorghi]|uniref:Integrase catalytic domain-containing protein n=1 Tax=Puccinia sorghi TaxID=27349 RepID=A0A0L6UNI8_9BASI|nr:uncharacterized protein VP01_45g7 [Puccinia sorghi]
MKLVDGHQYSLTIQDLLSSLVSQGELVQEIMWWIGQLLTLLKCAVKRLWTGNALEFISSKALLNYLEKMGIQHEKSAPYKHHQNGAVERTNWNLAEISRELIHFRALPW